jgi:glycosyltransferase involved in cell wall biosynthesis
MASRIQFVGQVTAGECVRRILDDADLFVLPSRTEGLPRAMIEAMARGLPCIGSDVGGIPELLDPDELAPVGDSGALASKILEIIRDPLRADVLSKRNIERAREFTYTALAERRRRFYRHVRDATLRWNSRPKA